MNLELVYLDIRNMLASKRTSYTIAIMGIFALIFSMVVEFAPDGLRAAMEAAVTTESAGVFEFIWFGDVLMFLLLVVVSFGAFIIADLEDEGTLALTLARPETRLNFLVRRTVSGIVSFFIVFMAGTLVAGIIARAIVGDLDFMIFIQHHIMLMPMLLFVIALTFFFSVLVFSLTYAVLAGFGATLLLSLTHTFATMATPGAEPSIWNPMAFGFRGLAGQELGPALVIILGLAAVFYLVGTVIFLNKDI